MATQSSIDIAQQMYVVYYGRPADPGGLGYWADIFDATDNLDQALNSFGNSAEFTSGFGLLTNAELIANLYQQMYGRNPDSGGLAFYEGRLDNGEATLASIGKQIADGSQNSDLSVLNNRISVANSFTDNVENRFKLYTSSDIPAIKNILSNVTEDEGLIASSINAIHTLVGGMADEPPSQQPNYDTHDIVSTTGNRQWSFYENDVVMTDDTAYSILYSEGGRTERWEWDDGYEIEEYDQFGNEISYAEYDAAGNFILDTGDDDDDDDISSSGTEARIYRDEFGNEHTDVISIHEQYHYNAAGGYAGLTRTETVVESAHLSGTEVIILGPDYEYISSEGSLWE